MHTGGLKKDGFPKRSGTKLSQQMQKMENPPQNTKLGGRIVIHGWNGDWIADGTQNLTWDA